jgi:malonyl-CoA/methylmalonyl-CoA synthetase
MDFLKRLSGDSSSFLIIRFSHLDSAAVTWEKMTNVATPLPKHVGPTILPDFPLFHRLLYIAVVDNPIAFHDVFHGIKATHAQFLSDVLHFRNQVQGELHSEIRKKLLMNEEVFICLIANGSYEFAVGFLAIVALGAIVVPIGKLGQKSLCYFVFRWKR